MVDIHRASNADEFDEPEVIKNPKRRQTKRITTSEQEQPQDADTQAKTKG